MIRHLSTGIAPCSNFNQSLVLSHISIKTNIQIVALDTKAIGEILQADFAYKFNLGILYVEDLQSTTSMETFTETIEPSV